MQGMKSCEEKVKEFGHGVNFMDSQKWVWSKKNRKAMIARFKFKLIWNSNGFELGLDERKVQKCSDFWWSSGKWWKNKWQSWRSRIKTTEALGFCKCVMVNSKNGIFYYSSLITGGYVIKRSHHVSSLGLNRSKDLCNLFRRVFKN